MSVQRASIEVWFTEWSEEWAKRGKRLRDLTWHPVTWVAFVGVLAATTLLVRPVSRVGHDVISLFGGFFIEALPITCALAFACFTAIRVHARQRMLREFGQQVTTPEQLRTVRELLRESSDASYELFALARDAAAKTSASTAAIALDHSIRVPEVCYSCTAARLGGSPLIPASLEHVRSNPGSTHTTIVTHRFLLLICVRCSRVISSFDEARKQRSIRLIAQLVCALWFILPLRVADQVWIAGTYVAGGPLNVAFSVVAGLTFLGTLFFLPVRDIAPTFGVRRAALKPRGEGRFWLHVENVQFAERVRQLNS